MVNDAPAIAISDQIQKEHLVFGFISETQFDSPLATKKIFTTGNGDGAIWTGCYLAAEAFRCAVRPTDTVAKANLDDALQRVEDLASVPESKFLTRTIFPKDAAVDPVFLKHFEDEEGHSGLRDTTYRSRLSHWVKHPTRDQYAGVLFGLGVTYDLIPTAQAKCAQTITKLVDGLIAHNWTMDNPHFPWFETFLIRPDHRLSVLQLAKHVNAPKFGALYDSTRATWSWAAGIPMRADFLTMRRQYSNLNLAYLYFYNLIHLETDATTRNRYLSQFATLRNRTKDHQNAHFNMINRAITGDASQDGETSELLRDILTRKFRDDFVEDKEVQTVVPVSERPYADFLWQRSPFVTRRKGDSAAPPPGSKESPGIDYILPYWMARFYNVIT